MPTIDDWVDENPARAAAEYDYGMRWTAEGDLAEWALTYNTGTGELYARTRSGDQIEVLGRFDSPEAVTAAIPDWGARSMQPGSLDWLRRHTSDLARTAPNTDADTAPGASAPPIYGVVVAADGSRQVWHEPPSLDCVRGRLGDELDVARTIAGSNGDRIVMWVDDRGYDKHLPVNPTATQLYGTGWPILGDAIVVSDNQQPLPTDLTTNLLRGSNALDYEDHHQGLESQDLTQADFTRIRDLDDGYRQPPHATSHLDMEIPPSAAVAYDPDDDRDVEW